MPKGPWEEPRTIFDAMITAQMRKMIPTAARIETQPAGSTESSFHTGGSQCMTQRCPQIVPCGQRMRLSSLVMRLSPVDGCLHSIVHEGWAWGVLAMKMVCTAGLLVGTTAGPDATPGGHSEVEVCGQWTWRSGRRQLQQSMRKLQTVPPKYSEDLLLSSKAKQGNAVTIYCATSADAIRSLTSMRHAVRHDSLLFKVHGAFWHHTTAS